MRILHECSKVALSETNESWLTCVPLEGAIVSVLNCLLATWRAKEQDFFVPCVASAEDDTDFALIELASTLTPSFLSRTNSALA